MKHRNTGKEARTWTNCTDHNVSVNRFLRIPFNFYTITDFAKNLHLKGTENYSNLPCSDRHRSSISEEACSSVEGDDCFDAILNSMEIL